MVYTPADACSTRRILKTHDQKTMAAAHTAFDVKICQALESVPKKKPSESNGIKDIMTRTPSQSVQTKLSDWRMSQIDIASPGTSTKAHRLVMR